MTNNIKNLRTQKHLSQEQLAEKARVSVRTIQRLEAGEDASIETLNLIAGALGVEVSDLFTKENQQADKVQEARDQLQYQLQRRREEYRQLALVYDVIFVIVMMAWGACFQFFDSSITPVMGCLWLGGWMLFIVLRKLYLMNVVDPKLDKKYPLTVNRVDKNEKNGVAPQPVENDEQLKYQLQRRREEYRIMKHVYDLVFIVVMMIFAAYLGFNGNWSNLASILWACGWMLFGVSRRWVQLNIFDRRLDKKYPLTASRLDKDKY